MPESTNATSLRAVVNTVVDGVILIDADGLILMFNPACEKLFQYKAAEVLGQNVKMLMPDSYRRQHDTYIDNYKGTGIRKIIGIGRQVVGERKDGTTFPMELSVGEAKHDGQSIFIGIIHDLTQREQAERELRESAARLKAVVDTAVDGIILINAEGIILLFNPACERLFGYHAHEVLGLNVKMLMPAPYREQHDDYIQSFQRTGERKIIGIGRQVVGRRKDGSTFPMDLSVGEAREAGDSNFVGIIHDASERNRTAEQLIQAQKMEVLGHLSGGIAHDFNNLLTVIIGNADYLGEHLKSRQDLQRLAEDIGRAGGRGAELTQRLLAFSRRQTLRPAAVDCNQLLATLSKLLHRTLRENIQIDQNFDGKLQLAFADPAQLESAILNLALNSQDAMPTGGRLTITTANVSLDSDYQAQHPEVYPSDYVMVAVTDDGEGMPPDVLEKAFEPFFTTKEVGKGSGLGLSMVYGFVKQSNGHVAIYSEPGLGTTIRLYIPIAPAQGARPSQQPWSYEDIIPVGQETVLVVEDDPFVRSYAVMSLQSLGYRVYSAVDGNDALKKLSSQDDIDVLFTDIVMPGGISGWDLADRAQELRPGLLVLLTSGYALETLAKQGRLRPGAVTLNKPYRKADLARRLREVIGEAKLLQ